jgi:hypothetical protein
MFEIPPDLERRARERVAKSDALSMQGLCPTDTFEFDGMAVSNPWQDLSGRFDVEDPIETYGTAFLGWLFEMRPIKFEFEVNIEDDPMDGFTDDTYWNGFINVWILPELHEKLNEIYGTLDYEFEPNENGLIEYGGGAVICLEYTP